MKSILLFTAVAAAAATMSTAHADDTPLTYDRVDLSATAQGQVGNDILVAIMFRQMEGASAAPLAEQVSKSVAQAVKYAKQTPEVKTQTMDYQTTPMYQDDRIVGWRVRQSLRLESADSAKLSTLLGELQKTLNLDSIAYEVSPDRMRQAEDSLIEDALKQFQQRADKVTRTLGRSRYRIVSLRVLSPSPIGRPMMMAVQPAAMQEAGMTPPTLEPGEQKVQMNVSGTIELQAE